MIKIEEYIKCYENVINDDLCEEIINQKDLEFHSATVQDGKLSKHRNCLTKPLNKKFNTSIHTIVGKVLNNYVSEFEYFTTGLNTMDTGYDHLLYLGSEKGEYKEHIDHFDLHPRVLSCSIILNDNYDGGDFSFFKGHHLVKKKKGSAIVFPSNFCFPHAVMPVSNGDRHSIITWIH